MNYKTHIISPALKILISLSTLLLLASGIIWIYFIVMGWIQIGHFPHYGDSEIISINGPDRKLILFSTITLFYSICVWPIAVLFNKIFQLQSINRGVVIFGLFIFFIDILLIMSPAFDWILD